VILAVVVDNLYLIHVHMDNHHLQMIIYYDLIQLMMQQNLVELFFLVEQQPKNQTKKK